MGAERRPAQGVPLDGSQRGLAHSWGSLGAAEWSGWGSPAESLCQRSHQLLPLEPLPEKYAELVLGSGKEGRRETASAPTAAVDASL